jgi:hypothetical protein
VTEARQTARNGGWVVAQRVLHVAGAAVFALVIPPMMGLAVYGRYALLTSVSKWFAVLSGLGAVSLMTRTAPHLLVIGERAALKKLVTNTSEHHSPELGAMNDDGAARRFARHEVERIVGYGHHRWIVDRRRRFDHVCSNYASS